MACAEGNDTEGSMFKITITLPKNRLSYGTLTLGNNQYRCLGRADSMLATAANNPSRDPLLLMGDTPLGAYTGTVVAAGVGSGALRSYGPNKRILLSPPPKGRAGLMLHGGAPSSNGGLRPTEGCVRLSNEDIASVLAQLGTDTTCEVSIVEGSPYKPSTSVT